MSVDEEMKNLLINLSDEEIHYLRQKAVKSGQALDKFIEAIISSYVQE